MNRRSATRRLAEQLARYFPTFPCRPVPHGDLAAFLLSVRMNVVQDDFSFRAETTLRRDPTGVAHVLLRRDQPEWLKSTEVLRQAIRIGLPEAAAAAGWGITAVALANHLNARDLRRCGTLLREEVETALLGLPELCGPGGATESVEEVVRLVQSMVRERGVRARRQGVAARDSGEFRASARLLRRAAAAFAAVGDSNGLARALGGLGKTYELAGDYRHALRALRRARRIARAGRHRLAYAFALHDLAALAIETRDCGTVSRRARAAFRAYPHHSQFKPVLVKDIAGFWVLEGHYMRAQTVLELVVARMPNVAERAACWALLARAAAGAGNPVEARAAISEAEDAVSRVASPVAEGQVLYNVGWALLMIGAGDEAREYANRAYALANEQGAALLVKVVRGLQEAIRDRADFTAPHGIGDAEGASFAAEVVAYYEQRGGCKAPAVA